jgi:predicted extracellular nuclease
VLAVATALLASLVPGVATPGVRALQAPGDIFISEFHYDNAGTDEGEFVEVTAPAGTNLTGWSVVLYNGSGGADYDADVLTGTVADQSVGFGTLVVEYPTNGLQNGSPDGIALVDNNGSVVEFLSYEGVFVATAGPANGVTSDDVGVSQNGSGPLGASIDRTDIVPGGYTFVSNSDNTKGAPNPGLVINGITIPEAASDPVTANCGTGALTVLQGATGSRTVTATDPDGTVVSLTITSPAVPGITIGATTPAGGVGGTASADVMVAGTTSPGTYQVEVTASNNDAEAQTGSCTLTVIVTPVRTIGEVQGPVSDTADGLTHRSPFAPASGNGNGQIVFVRGVVTQLGRFPTATGGQNWGFWLQSRVGSADGDATSSDGIFVFIGGFQTVLRLDGGPAYQPVVGDEILMRGTVVEFFNLTELGSPRLVEVSDTGVDVTDAAQVETTEAAPPDSLANANRFWERHEGMRFHLDAGAHVVAARDTFPSTKDGELWVIRGDHAINQRPDPYQRIVYRDPHPLDDLPALFDNGNGMRIMLQSHGLKGAANSNDPLIAPANTYDTVINEVAGSLYFAFNKYGIEITEQLELGAGVDPAANFAPQAVDPAAEFATSDYNVENLYDFRDDPFDGCDFVGNGGCPGVNPPFDFVPASEQAYEKHLTDLAAQIAGPMHAPDLLMIQEAEDQDICTVAASAMVCGTTNNRDGRPDTLQELALAITAAGGPTYVAAYDRDGADDRGIVSAFMYRTDTVELLPPDADDPVLGSSPTVDYRGTPLGYNSQVSNPKALNADLPSDVDLSTGVDGGNVFTRPPQVGHFRVWRDGIGLSVFTDLYAMSNHFSSTPNARVGQRTEQAAYNAAIVAALADAGADRVVSAGDFNVFPRPDDPFAPGQPYGDNDTGPSDQLGPMYAAGLHNLWDRLVAEVPRSAYSYSFDGQAQTLDMQWATDAQFADLVEVRAAHLNADFAADFDGDVARGASDHDPQVARWSTDATFARLHALVDYYVATGQLPANKAFLFHNRLDKAQAFAEQGKVGTARSQLKAFGNQAHGFASPAAADAMAKEADRLAELL